MQYANTLLALVLLAPAWAGQSQAGSQPQAGRRQSVASPCVDVPKPDRQGSEDYNSGFHDGYVAGCKAAPKRTEQEGGYQVYEAVDADDSAWGIAPKVSYDQQNQALLSALSHYCVPAGQQAREDTANMSSLAKLKYLVARLTDLVTGKYQCSD